MANINGKAYGLTAMTRMHPLKTFGLRAVFGAIQISLLPPAKRGAIAVGIAGPALVAIGDGAIRLLIKFGAPISVWRPAHDIGARFGLAGGVATLAGFASLIAGFALLGAIVGSVYQPRWTLLGKISQIQTDLTNLSFIHFARWVIIKRNEFPRLAPGQPTENLNYDYLLFESNFNGDWEKYIDAFSDVIPGGMDNIWRWSVRYPSSRPITPFLNYIRNCQYDTDHYYSAYPGASTNTSSERWRWSRRSTTSRKARRRARRRTSPSATRASPCRCRTTSRRPARRRFRPRCRPPDLRSRRRMPRP